MARFITFTHLFWLLLLNQPLFSTGEWSTIPKTCQPRRRKASGLPAPRGVTRCSERKNISKYDYEIQIFMTFIL